MRYANIVSLLVLICAGAPASAQTWQWPASLDATRADPEGHKVIFENDRVRILEIVLAPGAKSPLHTYRLPSYMYIVQPGKLRFFFGRMVDGKLAEGPSSDIDITQHHWTESEGPHAVMNIGTTTFRAVRYELKPKS